MERRAVLPLGIWVVLATSLQLPSGGLAQQKDPSATFVKIVGSASYSVVVWATQGMGNTKP
ncbi:MAG: hypothetical protein ACE5JQ_04200 [Candidatus Methylomirabilales bacterium]